MGVLPSRGVSESAGSARLRVRDETASADGIRWACQAGIRAPLPTKARELFLCASGMVRQRHDLMQGSPPRRSAVAVTRRHGMSPLVTPPEPTPSVGERATALLAGVEVPLKPRPMLLDIRWGTLVQYSSMERRRLWGFPPLGSEP